MNVSLKSLHDSSGGGAWPFLVGGVICLVNSVNERDPNLLNRVVLDFRGRVLLRGTFGTNPKEAWGDNRSVMPLDVLGRTRVTLIRASSSFTLTREVRGIFKSYRAGDRLL